MALTVNTNIINDTDQYLLDAKNVKGGYIVVNSTAERDNLPAATTVKGSLCYCTADSKFYQYNGTTWEEKVFGITAEATTTSAGLMSKTDKENLDLIVNSFNSEDADSTINTVKEVLKAFENAPEGTDIANALSAKQDEITATNKLNVNKIDGLATVAISGAYSDLSGTPDLNLENGEGVSGLQQKADGVAEGFDFTGKNEAANNLNNIRSDLESITGTIEYGATGEFASAFGGKSAALGRRSAAFGTTTVAKGKYSFASGENSVSYGDSSFTSGMQNTSVGYASTAQGGQTVALGDASHAINYKTVAVGDYSFAAGVETSADYDASAAFGRHTHTHNDSQFVVGQHNNVTEENAFFVVGNGGPDENDEIRHNNAFVVYEDGRAEVFGAPKNLADVVRLQELKATQNDVQNVKNTIKNAVDDLSAADTVVLNTMYNELNALPISKGAQPSTVQQKGATADGEQSAAFAQGKTANALTFAAGPNATASGYGATAFGAESSSSGAYSFVAGIGTQAVSDGAAAFGKYNKSEANDDVLFYVGNGETPNKRSNAFVVLKNGTVKVYDAEDPTGTTEVATQKWVKNNKNIGRQYTWSDDLITNQVDLGCARINFDTTVGQDAFKIKLIALCTSSSGYYLYVDTDYTLTFKATGGTVIYTIYTPTDGWLMNSIVLPSNFGYVTYYGHQTVTATATNALATLNSIAPNGVDTTGTIATQEWVNEKVSIADSNYAKLAYAECFTAANTQDKTATICTAGDTTNTTFTLVKGVSIQVYFNDGNTASMPTLNVNGTGAKMMLYKDLVDLPLIAHNIYTFVYDGNYWRLVGELDTDTDTTYTFNGAVSTIKDDNLTASRALISNANGKVAVSDVTSTELGYLDGVTSNIQTQLDGKAATSHGTHVSFTTTTPKANGTAAVGSATTVSRSDHVHPTDTSRAPTSHASSNPTTYGVGTTDNYGHVKIQNGDLSGEQYVSGVVAGIEHEHSQYAGGNHSHGNIANDGTLGTASRIVVTGTDKKVTTGTINPANLVAKDTAGGITVTEVTTHSVYSQGNLSVNTFDGDITLASTDSSDDDTARVQLKSSLLELSKVEPINDEESSHIMMYNDQLDISVRGQANTTDGYDSEITSGISVSSHQVTIGDINGIDNDPEYDEMEVNLDADRVNLNATYAQLNNSKIMTARDFKYDSSTGILTINTTWED